MTAVAAQVMTGCPWDGCKWTFVGTELRGRAALPAHLAHAHGGRTPEVVDGPVAVTEPDASNGSADGDDLDGVLAVFRRFHAEHGRWPLPRDAETYPDLPPKWGYRGRTWTDLWAAVGAGKIPTGRAAANYRGTTTKPHKPTKKREPKEPAAATADQGNTTATAAPDPGPRAPVASPRTHVAAADPGSRPTLLIEQLADRVPDLRQEYDQIGLKIDLLRERQHALGKVIAAVAELSL